MNPMALMAMFFDADLKDVGMWIFLSIGAVSLFVVFIPVVTWLESRRKEREAFYRAETVRRLAENTGEGAKMALELLKEEGRQEQLKKREGMKIGGAITTAVGVALCIFFTMQGNQRDWVIGLIPGLIGVAMLVYVYVLAAPVESPTEK
jgi:predicted cobalt transporter CbtA